MKAASKWSTVWMLLFCWPLGLLFVWRDRCLSPSVKWVTTACVAALSPVLTLFAAPILAAVGLEVAFRVAVRPVA